MALVVEDSIYKQFPGLKLVVSYAEGIDNTVPVADLNNDYETTWSSVGESWKYDNAQSHPNIAAWRTAFREVLELPARKHPSSIEALAKRAISGRSVVHINPLVDLYNKISIEHVVPVGGWDADELEGGDIVLRHTTEGETFHELGSEVLETVQAGEVCYADHEALITRHFVWRQSETAKVTRDTSRLFLVSEILPEVEQARDSSMASSVQLAMADQLYRYFGIQPAAAIIGESDGKWDWDR